MTSRAAILHEFRHSISVANGFGKRRHKKRQLRSRRIKRYEIMGIGKENFYASNILNDLSMFLSITFLTESISVCIAECSVFIVFNSTSNLLSLD